MIKTPEWAITNGLFRDTSNIWHTKHSTKTNLKITRTPLSADEQCDNIGIIS